MPVYSLLIINKAGGLVFQRDFEKSIHSRLSINEYLVIASTFQSVHAISSQLAPRSSGIKVIESDSFRVHCMETVPGTKFVLTTDNSFSEAYTESHIMPKIYEMYADYVLKSPFYTLEMPIKCSLFDANLNKYVQSL